MFCHPYSSTSLGRKLVKMCWETLFFWLKDKNKRGVKWFLSTCHWWETSSAVNELLQAELFTFLIIGWTFVWILIILNQTALELEPDSIVIAFPKQSFHHGKEMDNIYPHLVFLGKKMYKNQPSWINKEIYFLQAHLDILSSVWVLQSALRETVMYCSVMCKIYFF